MTDEKPQQHHEGRIFHKYEQALGHTPEQDIVYAVCTCHWASPKQKTEEDAWTAYDVHVSMALLTAQTEGKAE